VASPALVSRGPSAPSLRDMLAPRFYATRNGLRHRGLFRPAVLALLTGMAATVGLVCTPYGLNTNGGEVSSLLTTEAGTHRSAM
jgi:hypothetical protein